MSPFIQINRVVKLLSLCDMCKKDIDFIYVQCQDCRFGYSSSVRCPHCKAILREFCPCKKEHMKSVLAAIAKRSGGGYNDNSGEGCYV